MPKGYIRDPDPDDNCVLDFGTGHVKRQFKQNTDLLRDALKEPWRTRMLRVSLLMCPKVRKNFLRASKRRQKLMIEHMRGFLVTYHMGSGKIAPCTQRHNGPYRHRDVMLIERFWPTAIFEPVDLDKRYIPEEGDVVLNMRFNVPDQKPCIVFGNELKSTLGWAGGKGGPKLEFLPDSVGNPEVDMFFTRDDLRPEVAEAMKQHREELEKLLATNPGLYTYNPSFSIRAPQQPNTLSDGAEIAPTDLLNPIDKE